MNPDGLLISLTFALSNAGIGALFMVLSWDGLNMACPVNLDKIPPKKMVESKPANTVPVECHPS